MIAIRPIPDAALRLIRRWEGLRLKPYYDTAGIPTVCYGHVLSWKQGAPLKNFRNYTETECLDFLKTEVPKYAAAVGRLITTPLTEGMYAALISFTYNVGPGNLRLSTLRRMINRGDALDAGEQFLRWTYDLNRNRLAGLLSRRRDERAVYLSDIHMLTEDSLGVNKWLE